jgi:hypothetical protein
MSEAITFYSRVAKLGRMEFERKELSGWYMQLDGWHDKFRVGDEKPDFAEGDGVKVTIVKT